MRLHSRLSLAEITGGVNSTTRASAAIWLQAPLSRPISPPPIAVQEGFAASFALGTAERGLSSLAQEFIVTRFTRHTRVSASDSEEASVKQTNHSSN